MGSTRRLRAGHGNLVGQRHVRCDGSRDQDGRGREADRGLHAEHAHGSFHLFHGYLRKEVDGNRVASHGRGDRERETPVVEHGPRTFPTRHGHRFGGKAGGRVVRRRPDPRRVLALDRRGMGAGGRREPWIGDPGVGRQGIVRRCRRHLRVMGAGRQPDASAYLLDPGCVLAGRGIVVRPGDFHDLPGRVGHEQDLRSRCGGLVRDRHERVRGMAVGQRRRQPSPLREVEWIEVDGRRRGARGTGHYEDGFTDSLGGGGGQCVPGTGGGGSQQPHGCGRADGVRGGGLHRRADFPRAAERVRNGVERSRAGMASGERSRGGDDVPHLPHSGSGLECSGYEYSAPDRRGDDRRRVWQRGGHRVGCLRVRGHGLDSGHRLVLGGARREHGRLRGRQPDHQGRGTVQPARRCRWRLASNLRGKQDRDGSRCPGF